MIGMVMTLLRVGLVFFIFCGYKTLEKGHPRNSSPQNIYNILCNMWIKEPLNLKKIYENSALDHNPQKSAGMRGCAGMD